jgi:hypothetical protein
MDENRLARKEEILPGALRAPSFGSSYAASHCDTLPIDKCICDLTSGFVQIPPGSLARDTEFLCRFFLFQTFQIYMSFQLDLIGLL